MRTGSEYNFTIFGFIVTANMQFSAGDDMADPALLAVAASEFASFPGPPTDAAAKEFLDQFPLPLIFSVLKPESEVPGLEGSLVSCLERIFKTSYGLSFLPECMPYAQAGLRANSSLTRRLACKAIGQLLENSAKDEVGVQAIVENDICLPLIACLADGDATVAAAAAEAVKNLAKSPCGLELIFPAKTEEISALKELAMNSSSTVCVRVLAVVAAIFGISDATAAAVYHSNLLSMFEAVLNNPRDMLASLSALEVLYELATTPNGAKYLLTKGMFQCLIATISDDAANTIMRSRAMMISARFLSSDGIYSLVDESDVKNVIQAVDSTLELVTENNEREVALDALGQIGTVVRGAELLLSNTPPTARHIVEAAFCDQGRKIQLVGTHALASISGETRTENTILLNEQAETSLRNLIYTAAEKTSKRSPSGLFWSLLQQDPEIRLAAYRLIEGLVARSWCLWEVCSKQEIINLITDPHTETTKEGMEFRHTCCAAINSALMASSLRNDVAFSEVAEKLQKAVRRGPYLTKEHTEAKPIVATAERF